MLRITTIVRMETARVEREINRRSRKARLRAAGYVRTVAARSLTRSKSSSSPGSPPHTHTRFLKSFIRFADLPAENDAIIGPALTTQKRFQGAGDPVGQTDTIPQALEHSGTIRLFEIQIPVRAGRASPANRRTSSTTKRPRSTSELAAIRRMIVSQLKAQPTRLEWKNMTRKRMEKHPTAPRRRRVVTIAKRPFMRPALIASAAKLSSFWQS